MGGGFRLVLGVDRNRRTVPRHACVFAFTYVGNTTYSKVDSLLRSKAALYGRRLPSDPALGKYESLGSDIYGWNDCLYDATTGQVKFAPALFEVRVHLLGLASVRWLFKG